MTSIAPTRSCTIADGMWFAWRHVYSLLLKMIAFRVFGASNNDSCLKWLHFVYFDESNPGTNCSRLAPFPLSAANYSALFPLRTAVPIYRRPLFSRFGRPLPDSVDTCVGPRAVLPQMYYSPPRAQTTTVVLRRCAVRPSPGASCLQPVTLTRSNVRFKLHPLPLAP
jgi:hypothetical protein